MAGLVALVALSGCSSGGGGEAGVVVDLVAAAAVAARAVPLEGSVTQSSDTVGGVTASSVRVSVGEPSGGRRLRVRAALPGFWDVVGEVDLEDVVAGFATGSANRTEGGRGTGVSLMLDAGTPDGEYLLAGAWSGGPDAVLEEAGELGRFTPALMAAMEYGVFVDGSDPFPHALVEPLSGRWGYAGDAAMVWISERLLEGMLLTGEAALTADFDGQAPGSVEGRVSGFRVQTVAFDRLFASVPDELILRAAPVAGNEGGFFTGETFMVFEGRPYQGRWGGQFFGTKGQAPARAGGTFGATTEDGLETVLGVFAADLGPRR